MIGAGNVGRALGERLTVAGHPVRYGVPDPHDPKYRGLDTGSVREAAASAEVIVLATPWPATRDAILSAGDLSGKIVVDCTNPLKPDLSGLGVPAEGSAAEDRGAGRRMPKSVRLSIRPVRSI